MKRRDFLFGTSGATAALAGPRLAKAASTDTGTFTASSVPSFNVLDPAYIDPRLDSRSISAENPTGARAGGGKAGQGRKGNPGRTLKPAEKMVLANLVGPGTVRHIWLGYMGWPPEVARAQRLEVFYDDFPEPSISVPIMDFFALPHGRRAEYYSALISINEGLGLNFYMPMPFDRSMRMELTNESAIPGRFCYQIDYTLEPSSRISPSFLHVAFRRENPTSLRRDFVVAEGLRGPGRFIGCSVGIRVLDKSRWYGEGEVKVYRDGDREYPTYCGTGLEDYVGSAQNLGRHYGYYSGAPLNIPPNVDAHHEAERRMPDFVSFYRWHLPDPIMFLDDLRVTIQQIGAAWFKKGEEADFESYRASHVTIPSGWATEAPRLGEDIIALAGIERSDDYCATAYIYCQRPQAVARYNTELATSDVGLLPWEAKFDPLMSDR